MGRMLAIAVTAGLLVYPFSTFATDYGSHQSQVKQGPPVAQTLVREGDFAVELAAELDLGFPTNEAEAEDMLSKAEIVPVNGWMSNYPMTPEIVGQLQDSIVKAAESGKLSMGAEQATNGLSYLVSRMNLPTPAGANSEASDVQKPPQDQEVVNNYYYDQGPPIITYYPPPADYLYLYYWVPYPVVWFGFWFPGYYICHDFTTVVAFSSFAFDHHGGHLDHDRHGNHRWQGEHWKGIVSNHVIDPMTKRVGTIDPVVKTSSGILRAETILRSPSGRTFRMLADMRSDDGYSRSDVRKSGNTFNQSGFKSPEERKNAEAIYRRSMHNMNAVQSSERYTSRSTDLRGHPMLPNSPARSFVGEHGSVMKSFGSRDMGTSSRGFSSGRAFTGGGVCRGRC